MTAYSPDPRHLAGEAAERAAPGGRRVRTVRYSRWDGTQAIPALDADEIVDALADDLMAEGNLDEALRRLLERGHPSSDPAAGALPGLRELLERLRQRREQTLARSQLGDVLAGIREELEAIVDQERSTVQHRVDALDATPNGSAATSPDPATRAARAVVERRLAQLDELPPDVGGRIRGLGEYDFLDLSARERFEALVERLRRTILDQYVEGLSDAIRATSQDDLAANREMVRDLNRLLEERLEGGDPDASEFLARHGHFFPGATNLDEIVEQLGRRMAAMQSLMRSLRPEQRAELQSMMEALLRDDRLRWDLGQLAANLDQLLPDGLGERYRFSGNDRLGLEGALDQLAVLERMSALERQLEGLEHPGDLGSIDRAEVGDLIGDDAAQAIEALDGLARRLEEAGYVERRGDRLELTPKGSRRVGQKILDDLFARLRRDAFGGHRIDRAGRGGERTDDARPYEFGDPFHLDLNRTLFNALRRRGSDLSGGAGAALEGNRAGRRTEIHGGSPGAVGIAPSDFEVFRTEETNRAATVLLVDLSRSMLLRGCFVAAKRVALALHTLIRTQYPRDHLAVVGFAYYAREIRPAALPELSIGGYEYGTNLQHGLMLARRILARQHAANREIVVITDGEPTAHFEDGEVEFSYPPTRRTLQATLREVGACTREGITINTFMLERSRPLAEFVAHLTRLNRGRAFYAEPERLGEYVLVDFVAQRTKHVH